MAVLIAMFDLGVIVLTVLVAYLGFRVILGARIYFKFRGTRLVTCPETLETEVVEVAARSMGIQAILDEPCLQLSKCSRWPMREGCGQDCLSQIGSHPSVLRISAASRAS